MRSPRPVFDNDINLVPLTATPPLPNAGKILINLTIIKVKLIILWSSSKFSFMTLFFKFFLDTLTSNEKY